MHKTIVPVGTIFNKLTVLKMCEHTLNGRSRIICQCDCGNIKEFYTNSVKSGKTESCGCVPSATKHGQSTTKLYRVWAAMKKRCISPQCKAYKNYGGRGIMVCDEWMKDYTPFFNWAQSNGYKEGLHLDRINNDGNYEPSNCRFITPERNLANRRNTVLIEYNSQKKALSQWSKILGFKYGPVHHLLSKGIPFAEAIARK